MVVLNQNTLLLAEGWTTRPIRKKKNYPTFLCFPSQFLFIAGHMASGCRHWSEQMWRAGHLSPHGLFCFLISSSWLEINVKIWHVEWNVGWSSCSWELSLAMARGKSGRSFRRVKLLHELILRKPESGCFWVFFFPPVAVKVFHVEPNKHQDLLLYVV